MPQFRNTHKLIAACAGLAFACSVFAQNPQVQPPQNVVRLSAQGAVDVQQDWLAITLGTTQEGPDAGTVQNKLKAALDAALAQARRAAAPGRLEARTGNFSLGPRYASNGKISGWQGSAELVLEGRDFALVSGTAGSLSTMNVNNVAFSLSREQRAKVEGEAQAAAVNSFKTRASEIAKEFGFAGYTLREVSVNANDQGPPPLRPRMMAMEARAALSEAPVPVEAGKSTVLVTVAGTVQLK
ncbi:MAG: SIMPL domain-containing protein [Proteobacteria bacterium]|nr:SIMPL domain-containing protein [Pseudomonadota bacterium]